MVSGQSGTQQLLSNQFNTPPVRAKIRVTNSGRRPEVQVSVFPINVQFKIIDESKNHALAFRVNVVFRPFGDGASGQRFDGRCKLVYEHLSRRFQMLLGNSQRADPMSLRIGLAANTVRRFRTFRKPPVMKAQGVRPRCHEAQ